MQEVRESEHVYPYELRIPGYVLLGAGGVQRCSHAFEDRVADDVGGCDAYGYGGKFFGRQREQTKMITRL